MMALQHQWNAMLFLQQNKMPFWGELILIQDVETPVKKFTKSIGIEFYHSDL